MAEQQLIDLRKRVEEEIRALSELESALSIDIKELDHASDERIRMQHYRDRIRLVIDSLSLRVDLSDPADRIWVRAGSRAARSVVSGLGALAIGFIGGAGEATIPELLDRVNGSARSVELQCDALALETQDEQREMIREFVASRMKELEGGEIADRLLNLESMYSMLHHPMRLGKDGYEQLRQYLVMQEQLTGPLWDWEDEFGDEEAQ